MSVAETPPHINVSLLATIASGSTFIIKIVVVEGLGLEQKPEVSGMVVMITDSFGSLMPSIIGETVTTTDDCPAGITTLSTIKL